MACVPLSASTKTRVTDEIAEATELQILERINESWTSLVAQMVEASAYNVGDLGSIPGWGRSSGEGNGNPLQYPCLENPTGGAR